MNNRHQPNLRQTRGVCVVEVVRDVNQPPRFYQCLISLPGRADSSRRTWEATSWPLDTAQALDLVGWIETTVLNALESSSGLQGILGDRS